MERIAPDFVTVLTSCTVGDAGSAELKCRVIGTPTPKCTWYRNGQEVNKSDKNVIIREEADGTQTLVIKESHTEHAGEYRCEAINEAGKAWTEAPIVVRQAGEEPSLLSPCHCPIFSNRNNVIKL